MNKIWFISDTHFNHANVIRYCNRPFKSVGEMNQTIINNWNSVVSDEDTVFFLGDFIFGKYEDFANFTKALKGHKHFIIGNHDGAVLKNDKALSYFEEVDKIMHIIDGKNHICLCHFPIAEWNGYYKGHYHIYAHIHNNMCIIF